MVVIQTAQVIVTNGVYSHLFASLSRSGQIQFRLLAMRKDTYHIAEIYFCTTISVTNQFDHDVHKFARMVC